MARTTLPACLAGLAVAVLGGKKVKKAAKRLLAWRGGPGKLYGGKLLAAYAPQDGLAAAMAADAGGEANDVRLVPRALPLARAAAGPRLWVADRQFCDLGQPRRSQGEGGHCLVRFSGKTSFRPGPTRPAVAGPDSRGRTARRERGWMGAATQGQRRLYVRRITLGRPGQEAVIVVTGLLGAAAYPAEGPLSAYPTRWQIESVFQQITEVFELRHLIGSTPQATVFQAALCLAVYNTLQLIRG